MCVQAENGWHLYYSHIQGWTWSRASGQGIQFTAKEVWVGFWCWDPVFILRIALCKNSWPQRKFEWLIEGRIISLDSIFCKIRCHPDQVSVNALNQRLPYDIVSSIGRTHVPRNQGILSGVASLASYFQCLTGNLCYCYICAGCCSYRSWSQKRDIVLPGDKAIVTVKYKLWLLKRHFGLPIPRGKLLWQRINILKRVI